ncbi:hypothetical protein GCM10009641_18400 [Mycobacterium cookii]|uniref:Uncharacterized protein n=1 Tax=Mycobacterium cookii TaxID=1775 RepID=A0A7I7L220_9MYCO|nr:hypothetical protein MCOO_36570 [Mycobacterium cookii]
MTSRPTGKVYIAEPSQTVSGGTPTPPPTVSLVVRSSGGGIRLRSVGDIPCFLYPGTVGGDAYDFISAASTDGWAALMPRPPGDLIDAKP